MKISTSEKPRPTALDRARAYVARIDPAIENHGGDAQTFIVACKLVEFGLSQADASTVLSEYNQRCQPPWDEKGLKRKLRAAFKATSPKTKFTNSDLKTIPAFVDDVNPDTPKWPKTCHSARQQIITNLGFGLADLWELSPIRFADGDPRTREILEIIFPGNPLICCGKTSMEFWTKRLSEYGNLVQNYQLIVPSPMSKPTGRIQDPEPEGPFESAHTKDNTGPRIYAAIEFDQGTGDDHAALMSHLSEYAPLVMAVHSGGKSLHGWFYVGGQPEEKILRFYRYAVSLGADRATYLKSQFVRMPDGKRDNGARQFVYYLDPSILPAP